MKVVLFEPTLSYDIVLDYCNQIKTSKEKWAECMVAASVVRYVGFLAESRERKAIAGTVGPSSSPKQSKPSQRRCGIA